MISTPLGQVQEAAPKVFQNNRELTSRWKVDGDTISFEIDNYNPALPLLIDPIVRQWGTYYGGAGEEASRCLKIDQSGNVYLSGTTMSSSSIATTGAHQTVFAGGINGTGDAFVVKFDGAGVRQWATYYGGYGTETGAACAIDVAGNVYLSGYTNTGYAGNGGTVIATPNSYISTYTAGTIGFLVKFNSAGIRQWGTHTYGEPTTSIVDQNGDVYIAGAFNSNFSGLGSTLLPTSGAHQSTFAGGGGDGFITKFDSNGNRIWSTFYGGYGAETITNMSIDNSNNLYICGHGWTNLGTGLATPGSHQFVFGGFNSDGFLAKFTTAGVRLWGTYYGATDYDWAWSCSPDPSGNVYLAGTQLSYYYPYSGTLIATPGSYQSSFGGGNTDAYLVKFNSSGIRLWATYYGGTGEEEGASCACDAYGNVYLAGLTTSTLAISSSGAYQTSYGGGNFDGFLAKFDYNGNRHWGTYYGGSDDEYNGVQIDMAGNLFICGATNSTANIASSGSYQSSIGGGRDSFIAKFSECYMPNAPSDVTPISHKTICTGNVTTLMAQSNGNITWYASPTGTVVTALGAGFVTPTLSAGVYTYYAASSLCVDSVNATRMPVTLTVSPNQAPTITATSGSICSGQTFTIVPSGAATYTIYGGGFAVSPYYTTPYMISGTSSLGCVSGTYAISTITVSPSPTITVNGGQLCRGSAFTITPNGAFTYTITGGNYVVTPTVNASYSVTGTGSTGCATTNTAVANISVVPIPTLAATGGSICTGGTLSIGYSYSLTSNVLYIDITGNNFQVSPATTTSYTVSITDGYTFCEDTAAVTVVVSPPPVISLNGGTLCAGDSFTISPTGASSYTFSSGTPVVTPTANTNYSVTGTGSLGCISPTPAICSVSVFPTPVISVNSGSICPGELFTVAPSGASTYTISGGSVIVSPLSTTVYSITGTGLGGCINPVPVQTTVFINPAPIVAVNSGSVCSGESFTINASGANTYTYSIGPVLLNLTNNLTFSVTGMTNMGCVSMTPAIGQVIVNPLPTVAVNSGSICSGQSFTLNPSGAYSYSYSSGFPTVTPTTNTTYSVIGTNVAGCISVGAAISQVTVFPIPVLNLSTTPTLICSGESSTILASGASTYSMKGSAFNQTLAISPSVTMHYTVVCLDLNGCFANSIITQSVQACTDIPEMVGKQGYFKVYPNPNTGEFFIETDVETEIALFNCLSQIVLRLRIQEGKTRISTSSLTKGLYLLHILDRIETNPIKVVKD